ncbi:beta-glucoside-specific PTS transporter subunit IIABC [Propionispora vibrioides]|uniref:PTS system beta-glucoside-specific IIA component, Glc family /PTS system beta-glucoside-specific IIB component, Glc family /PTS system beta-glucoside-specific IIC component, Glc family n=1 Tax=Propionispora vibrioides TaxID=112903 RepID=A0A1H8Y1K6_9FIRM|nr:beta-glucoside-specific PTS transporter subunit IIABC [Propionispora vibrioides]SEP46184.1 PTS system beta-glucoside-specific IIA component, Glc family /PTS system beta-glucoside-specific IIB component, Glc family /PTS system beta-glucoside-specific IIC component, Glc family [Propionispora vibrioides]
MTNQELAKEILKNVGSESNINSLIHCVTRLRFNLKDNEKVNKNSIEDLDGVLCVVESGGQFQVVIGNTVGNVYQEFIKLTGLVDENREISKEVTDSSRIGYKALDLISAIFAPVLGILASVSLLKGLLAIAVYLGYISTNSSTYQILHAVEDSVLYFMPILIAFTAAKKFGANEFIALALGATLVYPGINLIGKNVGSDFWGIPVKGIDYSFTFIPIVIAIFILAKFEKLLNKVMNENLKFFFTPLICLIIMAPLTFIVIGPISTIITRIIGMGYNFVYNLSPMLLGGVVGASWQALVIRGIHWGVMPIVINNLSLYGADTFLALAISASLGQGGAVLGVLLKTKDKTVRKVAISTIPTGLLGITEPSIYGITLKYKIPFICASIGGAVGGAIAGYSGSATMGYIIPGFLTLPVYFGKGFEGLLIAVVTSYILAAVLSFITFKDQEEVTNSVIENSINNEAKENTGKTIKTEIIQSPLAGEVKSLEEVPDEVFAAGVLGKGLAINPSEGKVIAPVNGTVATLFPTGHAIGLITEKGTEILIHIGIDTVKLNGQYFSTTVKQGDTIKKGQVLIEFDMVKIKKAGYLLITPIIITNFQQYSEISISKEGKISYQEDLITLVV